MFQIKVTIANQFIPLKDSEGHFGIHYLSSSSPTTTSVALNPSSISEALKDLEFAVTVFAPIETLPTF